MPSEEALKLNDMMLAFRARVMGGGAVPTVAEQRASAEIMGTFGTEPDDVTITETQLRGRAALVHTPVGGSGRTLLYAHGGALVVGSPRSHSRLAAHIAAASGFTVINLDFRLAPEHPHPAALEDFRAAFTALTDQGHEADTIVLGGDSAGGTLALGTAIWLRDVGGTRCGGALLLSPWVDFTLVSTTLADNVQADALTTPGMLAMMREFYLGDADPADPAVSPALADLHHLPPILLQASSDEVLLGDAELVHVRATQAGLDTEIRTWPGVPHVFQLFAGALPEADEAVALIGDWLRRIGGLAA